MSQWQKTRLRYRLKKVDENIAVLVESGVKFRALEDARRMPKQHELTPLEKYWVKSKRYPKGIKPIHWVPKWTRAPHPRGWQPSWGKHTPQPPEEGAETEYPFDTPDRKPFQPWKKKL
ncbi:hypothetical protein HDV00_007808 [Rhizophlyctis rosea]|nr:hypothetical protein HDV00_007808 [Rhizophlyctis rosea]